MSYTNDVPNIDVAAQLFSDRFTLKFQSQQRLMNTTKEMYGSMGTTFNVPLFDKVEMGEIGYAPTDLPVSTIDSSNVQVVQNGYVLKTVVGVGQKTLFNFDYINALADSHAKAVGRMVDKLKIDAIFEDPNINPATDYYNVTDTVGGAGMNQKKLTDARSNLEYNGDVDFAPGMGSLWLPSINFIDYFQDATVTNQFFSNQLPLVMGQLNVYLGISHRKMAGPNAGNNYIPFTVDADTTTFTVPLVHRDAIQIVFNVAPQTQITYVPQQLRWEIVSYISAGCKVIQNPGIAIINASNDATALEQTLDGVRRAQQRKAVAAAKAYKASLGNRTPTTSEHAYLQELERAARNTARVTDCRRDEFIKVSDSKVGGVAAVSTVVKTDDIGGK
jgi:hypothetical protein